MQKKVREGLLRAIREAVAEDFLYRELAGDALLEIGSPQCLFKQVLVGKVNGVMAACRAAGLPDQMISRAYRDAILANVVTQKKDSARPKSQKREKVK